MEELKWKTRCFVINVTTSTPGAASAHCCAFTLAEVAAVEADCAATDVPSTLTSKLLSWSPREVQQLEARIDSLATRNAKLMDTLKDARQQLLALREEVDRLGQPPSGYGVLLGAHDDSTVDVFTSGRKMRLTCSPQPRRHRDEEGPDGSAQRGADRR